MTTTDSSARMGGGWQRPSQAGPAAGCRRNPRGRQPREGPETSGDRPWTIPNTLTALQQPVHGGLTSAEDRDVSIVGAQPQFYRANLTREPRTMRPGRDPILTALHDQDRRAYLPRVKAPRGDVSQVVIDHPAHAAVEGSPGDFSQPRPCTLQRGMICRREQFRIELTRREVVLERRAARCGRTQLRRAGGPHAREPIQANGTV